MEVKVKVLTVKEVTVKEVTVKEKEQMKDQVKRKEVIAMGVTVKEKVKEKEKVVPLTYLKMTYSTMLTTGMEMEKLKTIGIQPMKIRRIPILMILIGINTILMNGTITTGDCSRFVRYTLTFKA